MEATTPPLLIIVGPTASGKSHLAIRLAHRFDGEVINCDSVQLYRRFNIGTGKLSLAERQGVPHHLIDILEPDQHFTAGEYARVGREAIADIQSRGKLPIVAGGTGLYLKALIHGLFPGPTRNPELRERLRASAERKEPGYLHRMFKRLDPSLAGSIHPNDTPKLIRAIEVCIEGKRPMSELFDQGRNRLEGNRIIKLGLTPPRAELYDVINRRTKGMFESGLIDELRQVLEDGVAQNSAPCQSLGYREALGHLNGTLDLKNAIFTAQAKTRQYAKRQLTWFRREPGIHWLPSFGQQESSYSASLQLLAAQSFPAGQ